MLRTVAIGIDDPDQAGDLIAFAQTVAPSAALILVNAYAFDGALTRFLTLGYGDALRRDPAKVARDVMRSYYSKEQAEQLFGVRLRSDGSVDEDATATLRGRKRRVA